MISIFFPGLASATKTVVEGVRPKAHCQKSKSVQPRPGRLTTDLFFPHMLCFCRRLNVNCFQFFFIFYVRQPQTAFSTCFFTQVLSLSQIQRQLFSTFPIFFDAAASRWKFSAIDLNLPLFLLHLRTAFFEVHHLS